MENEIKVGEYVRYKDGDIIRIFQKIDREYVIKDNKDRIYTLPESAVYKDMVKHSRNLIDLIQCGDYVNGHKILEIKRNAESGLRYLYYDYVPIKYYVERTDKIESIATKEMMESISYKVKE